MSYKSDLSLSLVKLGYEKPLYDWQGNIDKTWNLCVVNNKWENNDSYKEDYFVYLYKVKIFEKVLYKIGVSKNIKERYKQLKNTIPFAIFTLVKEFKTKTKCYAEQYEKDFVIACRNYLVKGEWFDFQEI